MPRSRKITKKITPTDPVYNSRLVAKLINKTMHDGKKSVASGQIYRALEILKAKNPEADPSKTLPRWKSVRGEWAAPPIRFR